MNSKLLLFLALLGLSFATGCNPKSTDSETAVGQPQAANNYTEAELKKLIMSGMSIKDVTNKFGPPGSVVKATENTTLLTYMFPFEARQQSGPYLTGFSIEIRDEHVVRWSPVTGMTGKTIRGGVAQGSFGEQPFE